jgi:hypothetical protein
MDHDRDMIRIVESFRAAIEGGIIEMPFRRSEPPDQLRGTVGTPAALAVADRLARLTAAETCVCQFDLSLTMENSGVSLW